MIDIDVHLTVLVPFLFNKPTEASEAVLQLHLQSLKGICQLFVMAIVDVCTLLRFTYPVIVRII